MGLDPWLSHCHWSLLLLPLFSHSVVFAAPQPAVPGLSVLLCLPGLLPVHVHWVSDAILPSYPLPPPFSLFCLWSLPNIRIFSNESSSLSQVVHECMSNCYCLKVRHKWGTYSFTLLTSSSETDYPCRNLYHFHGYWPRSIIILRHLTRKTSSMASWPPIFTPLQKKVRIYFLKCVSDYTSPCSKFVSVSPSFLELKLKPFKELKRSVWTGLFLSLATLHGLHCIFSFFECKLSPAVTHTFLSSGTWVSSAHSYPNPFSYMKWS